MIAIKGAAMPKDCVACYFESENRCDLTDKRVESLDRPEWCPLVEIKEKNKAEERYNPCLTCSQIGNTFCDCSKR